MSETVTPRAGTAQATSLAAGPETPPRRWARGSGIRAPPPGGWRQGSAVCHLFTAHVSRTCSGGGDQSDPMEVLAQTAAAAVLHEAQPWASAGRLCRLPRALVLACGRFGPHS